MRGYVTSRGHVGVSFGLWVPLIVIVAAGGALAVAIGADGLWGIVAGIGALVLLAEIRAEVRNYRRWHGHR
jgi:uncharacterized membrane protein YoaK (UPF0700 family)